MTTKKIHHMQYKEKIIILNVIKFFDKEKLINAPSVPFSCSVKRAAAATGVSESTIKRLRRLQESDSSESGVSPSPKKRIRAKKILIDEANICEIRRKIAEFYINRKEIPSLKKLLLLLKEEIRYAGGREHLRKLLLDVGYKFKKCSDKRQIMLERSEIIAARSRFLRKLRCNDNLQDLRKPVLYLDEIYIGPSLTVSKNHHVKDLNVSEEYRWVIFHIGRCDSFVPSNLLIYNSRTKIGEPHNNDDIMKVRDWIREHFLAVLKESSIIITANSPYYPNSQQNLPPPSSKKQILQDWLVSNDIKFEMDMRNAELYELIQQNKPKTEHVIHDLFKSYGHEILEIPQFHCDLNPIEYIWKILRQNVVVTKDAFKSFDCISMLIQESFKSINSEDWYREIWNVKNFEWQYWNRDAQMEEEITKLGVTEDDVCLSSDDESNVNHTT